MLKSQIMEFLKKNPRIFGEIAACKIFEAILIVVSAKILVQLVNFRAAEFLIALFVIFALRILVSGTCAKKFLRLSSIVQTSFRKKLHEEIFWREISGGELLTLIFDTVQTLEEFFMKVAPNIFSTLVLLPIFLICAFVTDFLTAIILLVTLPIAPLLLFLIGKATAEKNSRAWGELQKLNGVFREILSAVVTLKMFGRIDTAAAKLKSASEKSSSATLEVLKLAFVSSFALELITTLSIALVAVTLGLRLVAGGVEFEAALFLLIIAPEFFLPIRKLGVAFHVLISARAAIERLQKFLSKAPEKIRAVEKIKLPPEILVDNVSYTYPTKNSPALREINLKIPAGKVTALVGESGSGKSTLLKLFAGLDFPTRGEIFFNELPTSKLQRASLLSKVAYMPQAPHLFNAPLAENFSMFGTLEISTLPELLAALDLESLELSAEKKISRGQLQRLGLIRALLKNSSLILLDEPTAGLDLLTEKKVLSLLKKFSARRTIVIATHRQAVMDFADFCVKLEVV